MLQGRKRSFFGSLFGSKNKREEELEAEKESRQKIEERIREVLAINETPELPVVDLPPACEPAMQANTGSLELVYGGSGSVHPRATPQSVQFGTHLQHESDSNLRIAPAKETRAGGLDEVQTESWPIRRTATGG